MDTKIDYIKSHTEHVQKFQGYVDNASWCPVIPDEWEARAFGCYNWMGVTIVLPFNRNMYQVVKDYFASIGWKVDVEKLDESKLEKYDWWTYMIFIPEDQEHYSWGEPLVEVRFDWSSSKSVCERKQIGTREVKEPVYEFTCK